MKIQILGSGCQKCKALTKNVEEAARDLGISCEIEKVTDIEQIISLGVMTTPALVVNGEVKSSGKVLTIDEIKGLLYQVSLNTHN